MGGALEKTLLCAGLSRVVLVGYRAVGALFPGGCEHSSAGGLGRAESGLASQPLPAARPGGSSLTPPGSLLSSCLLYTSDAADDWLVV